MGKWQIFYWKVLAQSNGERILKLDLYLAKLLTENTVGLFWLTVYIQTYAIRFEQYDHFHVGWAFRKFPNQYVGTYKHILERMQLIRSGSTNVRLRSWFLLNHLKQMTTVVELETTWRLMCWLRNRRPGNSSSSELPANVSRSTLRRSSKMADGSRRRWFSASDILRTALRPRKTLPDNRVTLDQARLRARRRSPTPTNAFGLIRSPKLFPCRSNSTTYTCVNKTQH